jgi:hypothetical protein
MTVAERERGAGPEAVQADPTRLYPVRRPIESA